MGLEIRHGKPEKSKHKNHNVLVGSLKMEGDTQVVFSCQPERR